MRSKPPEGFEELGPIAEKAIEREFSAVGVVIDFLPASKSRGSDYMITFTVTDPSCVEGEGVKCRIFASEAMIPNISSKGDVVVLRSFKLKPHRGELIGLANHSSSWIVFHQRDIPASGTEMKDDIPFSKKSDKIPSPDREMMEYAMMLCNTCDRSTFDEPAPITSLQSSNGLGLSNTSQKFQLVQDLTLPKTKNALKFADLLGQVRKVYMNDYRVELTVTDFTYNEALYDYVHPTDDDQGRDGDEFDYNSGHRAWRGPWGKMSIVVTAWDVHADYARQNVSEGTFVFLRNVQICMDRDGERMEGNMRGDRKYPDRIGISICKPQQMREDDRVKAFLRRKREYEADLKLHGIKGLEETKKQKEEAVHQPAKKPKLSKNAEKRRRKKEKEKEAKAEKNRKPSLPNGSNHTLNPNVRTNRVPDLITPLQISEIMSPAVLRSDFATPAGNPFSLPFKNNFYHLHSIRVIDFHPPHLAAFAAPHIPTDYDVLSDHESNSDSDAADMTDAHGADRTWEWRFELLVEDVRTTASSTSTTIINKAADGGSRMKILIAGLDADFLLRDVKATDLSRDPVALARLKEKLFLLWGDLQEQKEEAEKTAGGGPGGSGVAATVVKPSGRPFECLVKEYGVQVQGRWERVFAMFGTSIVSH